ncbi:MAG: hypothetical protein P8Y70_04855 [Candidatus Lokiarchaeota archaeon]
MNYYKKESLFSILKERTNYTEFAYSDNENGSVIISEYGGRPLGIFPKLNSVSLLWINPHLKEILISNQRDIGGDRYWLSPERRFFYRDPHNWEQWFCPTGLDPGYYDILKKSRTYCLLKSELNLVDQITKEEYYGKIKREISLIEEPIKTNLAYVAIEYRDKCVIHKPDLKINGWSLATVISGGRKNPGTVVIPTSADPKPLSYFRKIAKNRLNVGDNYVTFKIDVNDIYKLAIRPEDIDFKRKSKIGYILKIPDYQDYGFLVKLSDDIPKTQKECFDVARDHPNGEIGVIQSYNSKSQNSNNLRYGEIELQLNPFKTVKENSIGISKHQLVAYIGSREDILYAVEKYLGVEDPFLF